MKGVLFKIVDRIVVKSLIIDQAGRCVNYCCCCGGTNHCAGGGAGLAAAPPVFKQCCHYSGKVTSLDTNIYVKSRFVNIFSSL